MDTEDVWTRHRQRRHNAAAAAAATTEAKPKAVDAAAVHCAKVIAEAPHSYCKYVRALDAF